MDFIIKEENEESLREYKVSSKKVFDGKVLKLYFDRVRLPNNSTATREKVSHPGAVAVVPVNSKNEVLLVKQFRYPLDKVLIEIPAGKLDKNESPIECARRELEEEAGVFNGKIKHLITIYTSPGFSDEKMDIYLSTEFQEKENNPDKDEFLYILKVPLSDCIKMIENGKIKDAKTVIGIMCAKEIILGKDKNLYP